MTPTPEPIELKQGADGVYSEAASPGNAKASEARPLKKKRPAETRPADAAAKLDTAEPYMRVDVLALGALDCLLGAEPVYAAAMRPLAARFIARTLSPGRIERHLRKLERKLC